MSSDVGDELYSTLHIRQIMKCVDRLYKAAFGVTKSTVAFLSTADIVAYSTVGSSSISSLGLVGVDYSTVVHHLSE